MLGEAQWAWLEGLLRETQSEVTIIGSGIQVRKSWVAGGREERVVVHGTWAQRRSCMCERAVGSALGRAQHAPHHPHAYTTTTTTTSPPPQVISRGALRPRRRVAPRLPTPLLPSYPQRTPTPTHPPHPTHHQVTLSLVKCGTNCPAHRPACTPCSPSMGGNARFSSQVTSISLVCVCVCVCVCVECAGLHLCSVHAPHPSPLICSQR